MAVKGAIDGYLVKQIIRNDNGKNDEENLGVAFTEYGAHQLIYEQSEYYNTEPFEYSRTILDNGIAFSRVGEKNNGTVVMYTYDKCIIITGI